RPGRGGGLVPPDGGLGRGRGTRRRGPARLPLRPRRPARRDRSGRPPRPARAARHAGTDPDGRPDRITPDAAGQVALALAMSRDGATSWADLGVVLTWRLPGTGHARAAGQIDLPRARMIARITPPLTDEKARQVEAAVLGRAGWLTL